MSVKEVNTTKRCPIVLCLDISPSMKINNRIKNLNKAVEVLLKELEKDNKTKNSAEVTVVTFSTDITVVSNDFEPVSFWKGKTFEPVESGGTNMSPAILTSIELLENRLKELDDAEIEQYIPFLVLVTDGDPDEIDDKQIQEKAINALQTHCKETPLIAPFIIGVGEQVAENLLDRYAENFTRKAIILDGEKQSVDFVQLFTFIGKSIQNSLKGENDLGALYERIRGEVKKETHRIEEIRKNRQHKRM